MNQSDGLNGIGQPKSPGTPLGRASGAQEAPRTEEQRAQQAHSSAAFRALLEKFETNAEELKKQADDLAGPEGLKKAVSSARRSINEALVVGGDLLEAYRAAQQQNTGEAPDAGAAHTRPEEGPRGGR